MKILAHKSALLWGLAAAVCIFLLSMPGYAADFKFGPGDHYDANGNIVSLSGETLITAAELKNGEYAVISSVPAESTKSGTQKAEDTKKKEEPKKSEGKASASSQKPIVSSRNADGSYSLNGKVYQKDTLWGDPHKLSGYSAAEGLSDRTASGTRCMAGYTAAASSELPLGTVIIIEAVSGPSGHKYDGIYVVEDRGGYYLEKQGWIDLYFDSAEEADATTRSGWNYVNCWIAKPAK